MIIQMLIPFLKSNGKYSLIESENYNKGILEYEYLDFFHEGFAIAKLSNQWTFIDINEKVLKLEYDYDEIGVFKDGLAPVHRDDRWSFINKNGIEVTKKRYEGYQRLENGFIEVNVAGMFSRNILESNPEEALYISSYHTGLLNNTGLEIIPPIRECMIIIQDDFILIYTESGQWGVDFYGVTVINPYDYSFISTFYQNRAIGKLKKTNEVFIIDKNLNKIKSLGFKNDNELGGCYTLGGKILDGFINGVYALKLNNKWGFIDIEGNLMCKYEYDSLDAFINGFAVAGKVISGKMKFTFLNSSFEQVIPFRYDAINHFSEGFAAVELDKKWGIIDDKGKEIISPEFTQIGNCINGLSWVSYGDYKDDKYYGKYGFFDIKGTKICPIIYDYVSDFNSSCAIVATNEKYGLLNKNGIEIIEIKYDRISNEEHDFFLVSESDKIFVVNEFGRRFSEEHINSREYWQF